MGHYNHVSLDTSTVVLKNWWWARLSIICVLLQQKYYMCMYLVKKTPLILAVSNYISALQRSAFNLKLITYGYN